MEALAREISSMATMCQIAHVCATESSGTVMLQHAQIKLAPQIHGNWSVRSISASTSGPISTGKLTHCVSRNASISSPNW